MRKLLRKLSLVGLAACWLPGLFSCQSAPQLPLLQQQLRPRHAASLFQVKSQQDYFPMEHGRFWQFKLSQRQNGSDNTRYKTLNMHIETLDETPVLKRAVLRRQVSGSNVTPKPSLIQRFSDRVELSRYQEEQASSQAFVSHESLAPLATAGYIVAMHLPLQKGQCWEGRAFKGGQESICVKSFESLDLPAGHFDTVKIEHHLQYNNGKEDFLRYWYAPGVGMVKMHEELTVYFGQWLKLESTGVLTDYGRTRP